MSNNLLGLRIGDFALTVSTLPSFFGSPRTRSKFTHFPNSNLLLFLFTFLGGGTAEELEVVRDTLQKLNCFLNDGELEGEIGDIDLRPSLTTQ